MHHFKENREPSQILGERQRLMAELMLGLLKSLAVISVAKLG